MQIDAKGPKIDANWSKFMLIGGKLMQTDANWGRLVHIGVN